MKAKDKDPNLRVRWGRLYMEHWQPADASDLFGEALAIQKDYAPALARRGAGRRRSFEGKSAELAEQALKSDPKLYEAHELLAKLALEDNNPESRRPKPRRRSIFIPKLWTRWPFSQPSIGWTTKPPRLGSTRFSKSIQCTAKPTKRPVTFL